jgi:hypothetical protein
MWFVDVVIDLPWFTEKKGKLGKPKSRSRQLIPGTNVENEFLLYGDEHAIRHLRVMLHTEADQPPHDICEQQPASLGQPLGGRKRSRCPPHGDLRVTRQEYVGYGSCGWVKAMRPLARVSSIHSMRLWAR